MSRSNISNTGLLFGVGLALIGGFAMGFLFRGAGPGVARADTVVGSPAQQSTSSGALSPNDPGLIAPETTTDSRESGESGLSPALSAAKIDRTVEQFPRPELKVTEGDGVISGIVQDRDENPIPGVRVYLVPPTSSLNFARMASEQTPTQAPTLQETLKRAADRWAETSGLARDVITGADGKFSIGNLPDQNLRVRAELDGWRFRVDGPNYVKPGASVVMEGLPLSSFRVEMTASDGTIIEEGFVRTGGQWLRWTAADPIVHSTKNQTSVSGMADFYPELSALERPVGRLVSQSIPVDIAKDGSTSVTLRLEPQGILTGRVEGGRHGYSSVYARRLSPGETFDPTLELTNSRQDSGSKGVYMISGLLPGRYVVGLVGNDSKPLDHQVVQIVDGLNEIHFQKIPIDRSRCVAVNAISPTGTRVEGVSYGFEWTRAGSDRDSEGVRTFRDVGGQDLLDLDNIYSIDMDEWPAGTEMWLRASCDAYGKVLVPFSQGQREAEVQFAAPCEIVVKIHGDISMGGYVVSLTDPSLDKENPRHLATARQRISGSNVINRDGVAHFRGLAPGPVIAKLTMTNGWWGGGIEISKQELSIMGTDHRIEFQAVTVSDLAVTVIAGNMERQLRLAVPDEKEADGHRTVKWNETNEDGRTVFRNLPPGEYILKDHLTDELYRVTCPSGAIRWDLSEALVKIPVTISKTDGKLAQWGFQLGDLITAMDGEPFEKTSDLLDRMHLQGVTVTVERGESTIEIELPQYPRETRKKNPLGGNFYSYD